MPNNTGKSLRIFLWGAGGEGNKLLDTFESNKEMYKDYIVGFIDNSPNKIGHNIRGKHVYHPLEASNVDYDYIVITTMYHNEIKEQIMSNYHLEEYRILLAEEYEKFCYTRHVYSKYNNANVKCAPKQKNIEVVYTAIIGNYDELHDPLYYDSNVDYVCFSTNEKLKSKVWRIVRVDTEGLSDVMLARKIKLFPYMYLKGTCSSVWVDGKLQITDNLQELVNKYCNSSSIFCFSHFERNCIYDEAVACWFYNKVSKQKVFSQVASYYQEGYPFDAGLYETGMIYREHSDEIKKLMDAWWNEIVKFTHRDQISFPYVLRKIGLKPDITDLYIYKNKYLKLYDHLKV